MEGMDVDLGAFSLSMPESQKLELAAALLARSDRWSMGLARLTERFPDAPKAMLSAMTYHLYGELPRSLISLLAQVELSLRDPDQAVTEALGFDPVYHLYNWLQLEYLLPWAKRDVHFELIDVQKCLEEGDAESALSLLKSVLERFEGGASPPKVDRL